MLTLRGRERIAAMDGSARVADLLVLSVRALKIRYQRMVCAAAREISQTADMLALSGEAKRIKVALAAKQ